MLEFKANVSSMQAWPTTSEQKPHIEDMAPSMQANSPIEWDTGDLNHRKMAPGCEEEWYFYSFSASLASKHKGKKLFLLRLDWIEMPDIQTQRKELTFG